jgi:hypothetical protein
LLESIIHPPDAVVNGRWTIKRYDDIVHGIHYGVGLGMKQQSGREQRNTASSCTQHASQATPLLIQLRLTAGENHPLDPKIPDGSHLHFEVCRGNLLRLPNAPDIAHYTAAIASIMWKDNEHWQSSDSLRGQASVIGRTRDGYKSTHPCTQLRCKCTNT